MADRESTVFDFSFEHTGDGNWGYHCKRQTLREAEKFLAYVCARDGYSSDDFHLATISDGSGHFVWDFWAGSKPIPEHICG